MINYGLHVIICARQFGQVVAIGSGPNKLRRSNVKMHMMLKMVIRDWL